VLPSAQQRKADQPLESEKLEFCWYTRGKTPFVIDVFAAQTAG
jgi:hypothetical protein